MNPSRQRPSNTIVFNYTLISVFGAILVLSVATFLPFLKISPTLALVRKPIVGALYIGICSLGLVAAIFPRKCMSKRHAPKISENTEGEVVYELEGTSSCMGVSIHHGHHPGCETFDSHELILGRKSICAGCLGLAIGAIISICGTLLYFGDLLSPPKSLAPYFIIIGTTCNMVMLGRYFFLPRNGGAVRAFLHASMVVGASCVLVGIDILGQNLFFDYGTIVLVLFWLRTKMLLTKWEHKKVCAACDHPCAAAY